MSLWVTALVKVSGEFASSGVLEVVFGLWFRSLRRMRKVRLCR